MTAAERKPLRERYGADLARLIGALETDRDDEFLAALDDLVSLRRRELFARLRRLTSKLQTALDRFNTDSRFAELAEREVPDARARLAHVLKLTDEAAHRTMDLVDQSVPLAGRASDGAEALSQALAVWQDAGKPDGPLPALLDRIGKYLVATRLETDQLKRNLNEVVLAQTFQDLTGQIIRGVIALVQELETTLAELIGIAGADGTAATGARPPRKARATDASANASPPSSFGPIVPGVTRGPVVTAQADVDDLLSGLGL
jgi:chemotaxis protein CheZ